MGITVKLVSIINVILFNNMKGTCYSHGHGGWIGGQTLNQKPNQSRGFIICGFMIIGPYLILSMSKVCFEVNFI